MHDQNQASPYKKNYSQLRNEESQRNSLLQGIVQQVVTQYQLVGHESWIGWTHVIKNVCVHVCVIIRI